MSKQRDVDALVQHIQNRTVSICVNSAGIASFGPFMAQDWEYETNQFNLNATAVFRITKAVLDQMVARGEGALCNVGSAAGNLPIPNNATYVFTKAGVNMFTEALHYELARILGRGPFPAGPEELRSALRARYAPDDLVERLRALPSDAVYANAHELAVALVRAGEEQA